MNKRLFTLYELAIVIVVLAVIASIVIPNVTGRTADARVVALKQDLAHIEQALMQHEMEDPEVEILSKMDAKEVSPRLKTAVEQHLSDDASELYRINMKELTPYLHKTKYGHLEDDEDEYFYSKKTGLVYYEKGVSPSKGDRVHFLGQKTSPKKPHTNVPPDKKVKKVYASPAATYFLMENGDLYGEGYNYNAALFTEKNVMTDQNTKDGTLVYQKRTKIAAHVKSLHLSPMISVKHLNQVTLNAYVTEDDVAHIYMHVPSVSNKVFKAELKDVRSVYYDSFIHTDGRYGSVNLSEWLFRDNFVATKGDVILKDILGGGIMGVKPNGEYVSGYLTDLNVKDEDKGKPIELVRLTAGVSPLFRIGTGLYRYGEQLESHINGERVVDVDSTYMFLPNGSHRMLSSFKTDAKNLYFDHEKIDSDVSTYHFPNEENLLYIKGSQLFRYNPKNKTKTLELEQVKSLQCGNSGLVLYQSFCVALTTDGKLYIGTNKEPALGIPLPDDKSIPFRLGGTGVSSYRMNESYEARDTVLYEDASGATHVVRDNNGIIENRTAVDADGAVVEKE